MPAIKAFVTAGAVLCSLVLICPPSYATAVGWTSREGAVRGFVDADQAGLNIAGSVESADAGESPTRPRQTMAAVACHWQVGYAAADELLTLRPESTGLIGIDRVEPDGSRSRLYARVCGDQIVTWQWLRTARVGDAVASVAQEVRRRLPAPRGRFSPDLMVGAVVRLPLWFAVPGQWSVVSVSAQVPGASVTVTATPTRAAVRRGRRLAAGLLRWAGARVRPGHARAVPAAGLLLHLPTRLHRRAGRPGLAGNPGRRLDGDLGRQ